MIIKIKISRQENADNIPCAIGDIIEYELEEYVKGVVPSEMSGPMEALKAQAVAARTIGYKAAVKNLILSDLSTKTQAFREVRRVSSLYPQQHKAVEETAGEVLFYDDKIIETCAFSASNGGQIVSSAEKWGGVRPYLISKPDPYDKGPRNGHQVGMSQQGAKQMASLGFSYIDILNFYYPGTTITKEGQPVAVVSIIDEIRDWLMSKVGCGYAWGATGYVLTQSKLNSLIKQYPDYVSQSKNGRWLGKEVFDCAQLVRLAMKKAGINMVSGASSQWKKTDWEAKGTIDTIPKDKMCCLYREAPTANPMQHTGIYLGNGYVVDARGSYDGVLHTALSKYKWTHWGIPKGLYSGEIIVPEQEVYEVLFQATVIATSGKTVRMRAAASTAATVLKSIKLGQIVDVIGESGDWYKIVYNGQTGYMQKKFLKRLDTVSVPSKSWYVKVECESEDDAKTIVGAIQKLAKAQAVEE